MKHQNPTSESTFVEVPASMHPQQIPHPPELVISRALLSSTQRIGMAVLGFGLLAMLVTAANLRPDPTGLGTHQQLGLPPCTTRLLLGIRCPGCGMTTSWAHAMRGHISEAAQTNVAGVILCCLSILSAPLLLYFAYSGLASKGFWFSRTSAIVLCIVFSISLIEWLIRLAS